MRLTKEQQQVCHDAWNDATYKVAFHKAFDGAPGRFAVAALRAVADEMEKHTDFKTLCAALDALDIPERQ